MGVDAASTAARSSTSSSASARSLDYEDERFTLDDAYVHAVMKVFVDLYDKGLIYRDNYMVNWDPGSRSAISDLEVEEREVTDTLYYVDYPLASGNGSLTVATVRPETMLADTAIAVHPDDDRYTRLVGETAILPLVGRRLTIIADPYVKPEFGTGALKITPGHDPNDFEIGRNHGLEEISAIGEDGRMTEAAGERFAGHDGARGARGRGRRAARGGPDRPHRALRAQRALLAPLGRADRAADLAAVVHAHGRARRAPRSRPCATGASQIKPEGQRRRYVEWLENIRPWCISRQLWWGHQIPVYYRGEESLRRASSRPRARAGSATPTCSTPGSRASCGRSRRSAGPRTRPALRAFYPTDVLSTARDILFLWVARMVMMGLEFTGDIPFSRVNVHTVIQAPDGRRMSKSLGTGIDPLALIDGGPRPPVFTRGRRLPRLRRRRRALGPAGDLLEPGRPLQRGARRPGPPARQQALQRQPARAAAAARGRAAARRARPRPRRSRTRGSSRGCRPPSATWRRRSTPSTSTSPRCGVYDFVYGELCDWYLELIKPRLYEEDNRAVGEFALHVLAETLALAHPLIPFVTEEIWATSRAPTAC